MVKAVRSPQQIPHTTLLVNALGPLGARSVPRVATFIKKWEDFGVIGFDQAPADLILEMGVSLQIWEWTTGGIAAGAIVGLSDGPPAHDLHAYIEERANQFNGSRGENLCRALVEFYESRFALQGYELLGADILLGSVDDEDAFVDAFAEYVWNNRHVLPPTSYNEG